MAFSGRPNSHIERLHVANLTLTLSILIAIPANQVRAETTYDAGFGAVGGSVWAQSGGANGSVLDSDDSLPEASVGQSAELGQISLVAGGSAGKHGLKANVVTTRKPAPFGNSASGASWVIVEFIDTVVISPNDCAPDYGVDTVSFNCFPSDTDIEVPVTPNLSVSHVLNPQVGISEYTPVIFASTNVLIQVAYGTKSAQANFHRCVTRLEAGGPQVPCDGSPDELELDGFISDDQDATPEVFSGQLNGSGAPLPVLIPKDSSTGDFSFKVRLTASGSVGGQSDINAVASVEANKTISYAKSGPVFNLPEGWTAWSTSGVVRNNRWVEPSLFDDGFEALQ